MNEDEEFKYGLGGGRQTTTESDPVTQRPLINPTEDGKNSPDINDLGSGVDAKKDSFKAPKSSQPNTLTGT